MSKQRKKNISGDIEQRRAPISGASEDCGLVVRRSDFLRALKSPDVEETLARAEALMRSPDFPPEDPHRL